jgi:hypothetical protein
VVVRRLVEGKEVKTIAQTGGNLGEPGKAEA